VSINELKRRFPHCSEAFLKANADRLTGLRPDDTKSTQRRPLERRVSREEKSRPRSQERTRIRFRIYSTRPADWDNYSTKQLQDCLIKSGLLDGDDWDRLLGEVIPEKVHSKAEERTVIEIFY
jgi:hypothetical protein